jgi:hypothetical protein
MRKTKTSTPDLSMSDILKELLGTVSDTFDNSIQALSEPNQGGVFCFCCHFIENAVDKFCFYIAWCVGKSGFGLSV